MIKKHGGFVSANRPKLYIFEHIGTLNECILRFINDKQNRATLINYLINYQQKQITNTNILGKFINYFSKSKDPIQDNIDLLLKLKDYENSGEKIYLKWLKFFVSFFDNPIWQKTGVEIFLLTQIIKSINDFEKPADLPYEFFNMLKKGLINRGKCLIQNYQPTSRHSEKKPAPGKIDLTSYNKIAEMFIKDKKTQAKDHAEVGKLNLKTPEMRNVVGMLDKKLKKVEPPKPPKPPKPAKNIKLKIKNFDNPAFNQHREQVQQLLDKRMHTSS